MQAIINLDLDIVFDSKKAHNYNVAHWSSIIIKDLQSYDLPLGEDYKMCVFTFGEEVSYNFSETYMYVASQYQDYENFISMWPAIDYIVKVADYK